MELREQVKSFIGKTVEDFKKALEGKASNFRVIGPESGMQMGTMDFVEDRVNIDVADNVVKDAWVG